MASCQQASLAMGGGPIVSLPAALSSTSAVSGGATAGVQLTSTGLLNRRIQGTFPFVQNWINPTVFAPGSYEVMFSVTGGTVNVGDAVGTWLALTSTRSWARNNGAGVGVVTGTLQIRLGVTVLATCNCTFTADAT